MPNSATPNLSIPEIRSTRDGLREWADKTYGPDGWRSVAIVATIGPHHECDTIEVANPNPRAGDHS